MNMRPLNRSNIKLDDKGDVPRILQFGTGNFLRAFAGPIIEQLNQQSEFAGQTIIIKNTPSESTSYHSLLRQEGLYHVVIRGIESGNQVLNYRLITHANKVVHPWLQPEVFLRLAESPTLEYIISNTTEAGIVFKEKISWEEQPSTNFPAMMTQLLYRRFQYFTGNPEKGWVFLPCELIKKNGDKLRRYILQYAQLWNLEQAFSDWINQANIFCDSLVDRIVPGFPVADATAIQNQLGFNDELLVSVEPYLLWAIEAPDQLRTKLPLDKLGLNIRFTKNLESYRTQKVRILNGAHTSMVALGLLASIETVKDAVEHQQVGKLIQQIIFEEILPTLDYPSADLEVYANTVMDRFRNPFIQHFLYDISLNSIAKFKVRVLPSLLAFHKKTGHWPAGLIRAFASLIRYYKGDIRPIRDEVEHIDFFKVVWQGYEINHSVEPLIYEVLEYKEAWGENLREKKGLSKALSTALTSIVNKA
jgi:tagaturonate reductase